MDDLLFLASSDFGFLVEWIGAFVSLGVGLSVVFWIMGYVVWAVIDLVKGGV